MHPGTTVTLVDEEGVEFAIWLPGVFRENAASDIASALQIIEDRPDMHPAGEMYLKSITYEEV